MAIGGLALRIHTHAQGHWSNTVKPRITLITLGVDDLEACRPTSQLNVRKKSRTSVVMATGSSQAP